MTYMEQLHAKGWTRKTLAERWGCTPRHVTRIAAEPKPIHLDALAGLPAVVVKAADGLVSWRYRGPWGYVYVGTERASVPEALDEVDRSLEAGEADPSLLEILHGGQYVDFTFYERTGGHVDVS